MENEVQFIFDFLNDLTHNNHKAWMDANRSRYQQARQIFIGMVEEVLAGLEQIDPALVGVDAKKALFRINRDIRFSKNKDPYKTNFAADLSPMGKQSPFAGYYLHLEPGLSMIGGGCYHPEPKVLAAIRQEIDYNGQAFEAIIKSRGFKEDFGDLWAEEKLKRAPKGYDETHDHIEYLKLKSFVAVHSLNDKAVTQSEFIPNVLSRFRTLSPFVKFLNAPIADL